MRTEINTQLIKDLLNRSTLKIAPATLEKLRQARTYALDHQRVRSTAPVIAWMGGHTGKYDAHHGSKSMHWAVAALFVACLISGATFWHNYATEHEISELDIAILTDDMPLHVFVD